jgi:hypothetical protein
MHRILKPFKHAYHGIDVVEYAPGLCELPEEAAVIAEREGWAEPVKTPAASPAAGGSGHRGRGARGRRGARPSADEPAGDPASGAGDDPAAGE